MSPCYHVCNCNLYSLFESSALLPSSAFSPPLDATVECHHFFSTAVAACHRTYYSFVFIFMHVIHFKFCFSSFCVRMLGLLLLLHNAHCTRKRMQTTSNSVAVCEAMSKRSRGTDKSQAREEECERLSKPYVTSLPVCEWMYSILHFIKVQ